MPLNLPNELIYILLAFALLVVPRALQRFRLPAPLTSFVFGMAAVLLLGVDDSDDTLSLLASLGISSLFLFAGMEVNLSGLRRRLWALLAHLLLRSLTLVATAWAAIEWLHVSWQTAALLALAILTPSTGFILESLEQFGLNAKERFWISTKAIGGELLALAAMFVVLQSGSAERLVSSSAALAAMLLLLPVLFIALGRLVIPYAPGSEFSLLIMVGLLAAYLSKQLGVYYLVGAFITGLVARLLYERMPTLASRENLHAVKLFASFFVPFYFFYRGMHVPGGALQWSSLSSGLALSAVVLPLRVGALWVQRRFLIREDAASSLRVALALTPTLIFTLVLATILHDRFGLADDWYGALLVYAALSTMLPSIVLGKSFSLDATALDTPLASTDSQPEPAAPHKT